MGLYGTPGQTRKGLRFDSDRERPNMHNAIAEVEAIAVRPGQSAFVGDVTGEIGGVDLGLEADQIIVTERGDQLIVVG